MFPNAAHVHNAKNEANKKPTFFFPDILNHIIHRPEGLFGEERLFVIPTHLFRDWNKTPEDGQEQHKQIIWVIRTLESTLPMSFPLWYSFAIVAGRQGYWLIAIDRKMLVP